MATELNFGRDVQGFNAYAPAPSVNMYSATLAAGANDTITLPKTYPFWIVVFGYAIGSTIWVAYNTTASAPAGGTFAATSSELLPSARILPAIKVGTTSTATTINIKNTGAAAADVWVGLYAVTQ